MTNIKIAIGVHLSTGNAAVKCLIIAHHYKKL